MSFTTILADKELLIRTAVEADMNDMCHLLDLLLGIELDFEPDATTQAAGMRLLMKAPGARVLVAEYQGRVVGMCSAQTLISTGHGGESLLIEDIVMDHDFRGIGLGPLFLDEMAKWVKERGMVRMQLMCDNTNTPAQKFYEKNGWKRTELTTYFKFPEEDI